MQEKTKQWLNDFFILNAGTLLTAVGSYFFKFPNNFSTGGVTGISVVLTHYFPGLSNGTIVSVINIALLIVGLLLLGKGFGFKTFYVTVAFSAMLKILEVIWPMTQPLTDQPFMELLLGVFLPAWGSALLFNIGSSTGGTDIIAMIVKKYFKCHIGRALLIVDFFITLFFFDSKQFDECSSCSGPLLPSGRRQVCSRWLVCLSVPLRWTCSWRT